MFIQELIFIYCDKIINSKGTNTFFQHFFLPSTLSAFFCPPCECFFFLTFFFILFLLKSKQKSGKQTVMMSSYGTELYCTQQHKNATNNGIKHHKNLLRAATSMTSSFNIMNSFALLLLLLLLLSFLMLMLLYRKENFSFLRKKTFQGALYIARHFK